MSLNLTGLACVAEWVYAKPTQVTTPQRTRVTRVKAHSLGLTQRSLTQALTDCHTAERFG